MRFFWLALAIIFPLALVLLTSEVEQLVQAQALQFVFYAIACLSEIVFIALCVSDFVRHHKEQEYVTHQKIRHDRDEDIKKWRKEFMRDSLDLYEMQNESLKRAEDLAGRNETRTEQDNNPIKTDADAGRTTA